MQKIDKEALEEYQEKLEMIRNGAKANLHETKEEKAERIERLKKDPDAATQYYFGEYMQADDGTMIKSADFQIQLAYDVIKDPICKILVRWGRGLAKSVWCCVFIAFWLWMNDETFFMVIIGNNLDKAKLLLADLQAEFEANPRIIHDFGEQLSKGNWTKGYFRTKNGFVAKALGMGQSARGLRKRAKRPDLIIPDDLEDQETSKNPVRQKEIKNWLLKDVIPTMDGPRRRYLHPNNDPFPVSIQNMLEADRIKGKKSTKWKLSLVKAYDPITYKPAWESKYTPDYYREMEDDIGVLAAHAEFNHEGVIEGEIFKAEMIQWEKRPRLDHFDALMSVWDVAYSAKNDFNAVPVWGLKDRQLWKIKQYCKKSDMATTLDWMYEYDRGLPNGVSMLRMVEKQFWNEPVQQAIEDAEIRHGYSLNILVLERPRMDKYMRILTMYPLYQGKRIKYADSEKYDEDMKVANAQLFGIEQGYKGHDDAPDADEQTINELLQILRTDQPDNVRTTSRSSIISRQKNRY